MTLDLYLDSLRCEAVEDFLHFPCVFPLSVSLFFANSVSIRDHLVPVSFPISFIIVHHYYSLCLFSSFFKIRIKSFVACLVALVFE